MVIMVCGGRCDWKARCPGSPDSSSFYTANMGRLTFWPVALRLSSLLGHPSCLPQCTQSSSQTATSFLVSGLCPITQSYNFNQILKHHQKTPWTAGSLFHMKALEVAQVKARWEWVPSREKAGAFSVGLVVGSFGSESVSAPMMAKDEPLDLGKPASSFLVWQDWCLPVLQTPEDQMRLNVP